MPKYKNPTPVVVALIPFEGPEPRLLGIIRGIPPAVGRLVMPGGYVEEGQTAESALSLEVEQECGLFYPTESWQILCTRNTGKDDRLLIFATLKKQVPRLSQEAFNEISKTIRPEVQGYEVIDAKSALGFPLHQEIFQLWLAEQLND